MGRLLGALAAGLLLAAVLSWEVIPDPAAADCCQLADASLGGHAGQTCIDDVLLANYGQSVAGNGGCDNISDNVSATPHADNVLVYAVGVNCTTPGNPDSQCIAPDTPTPTPAAPTSTETATVTGTATATPTATATGTNTAIPPTVSDTSGFCRATGDKVNLASATSLTQTSQVLVTSTVVVPSADDPYFFQCNLVLFNQTSSSATVTLTLSEAGGLFAPVNSTFEIGTGGQFSVQIPFQTYGIVPGSYTLRCAASTNRRNALVAQPATYVGAWRLGASTSNCPGGPNGGLGAQKCVEAEVQTTPGATSLTVPTPIPAGAIVDTCLAETVTAVSGGYRVGFAGAPSMFGKVSGAAASSNATDGAMPDPVRVPGQESLRLTSASPSGQFPPTPGRVRAVCYCRNLTMPTRTPTP